MIQRVAMINSNNTQLNSDYDFTKLWKWLLGNQGGIEEQSMFNFDLHTKQLVAGATIANAYILCTRPTSTPIQNQTFLAHFEFTGTLEFLDARDGDKIFIEIHEELITDPTKIEDLDPLTEYAKGLGIGAIKIAQEYPTHTNYLKLWKIEGGQLIDERRLLDLPKIQAIQTQLDEQKNKVSAITDQVSDLQKAGLASKLSEQIYPLGEAVYKNDILFVERIPTADEASDELKVGADEASKMVAIPLIASGEEGTSITLPIKKTGNPSTHLVMELRTDNNGQPSDQLYHTNARISLAPSEITTNKTTITANFQGSFPAPEQGQRLRLVISQQDTIINSTNYYSLYRSHNHSTVRGHITSTDGISWHKRDGEYSSRSNGFGGSNGSGGYQDASYSGVRIVPKTFGRLQSITKISSCTATSVRVRRGTTILGTYPFAGQVATLTPPLNIEKGVEYILETYNNGQPYLNYQKYGPNTSPDVSVVGGTINMIDNTNFLNIGGIQVEAYTPQANFVSLSSPLVADRVLAKASARYTHMIPTDTIRISQQAGGLGQIIPTTTSGTIDSLNGLVVGRQYFLHHDGLMSLSSGTSGYPIGVALTGQHLNINTKKLIASDTTRYTASEAGVVQSDGWRSLGGDGWIAPQYGTILISYHFTFTSSNSYNHIKARLMLNNTLQHEPTHNGAETASTIQYSITVHQGDRLQFAVNEGSRPNLGNVKINIGYVEA